jgi:hypothetical protein
MGNCTANATNVFYKVEIDTKEAVQPIIYFRKAKRCKTAKGADRQHNRIVNETVEAWRQYDGQIKRYTVSRVPADVVVHGDIR